MRIKDIKAREILDSRGNPTIEAAVVLDDDSTGVASVPSGASTGKYEAVELRDNDPKRYNGAGVLKAIKNVRDNISRILIGKDAVEQAMIDKAMIDLDGTENKAKLGANAILSVSLAVACAQADSEKKPLYEYLAKFNPNSTNEYLMPIPQVNIINGGRHANWATDIQEYMILPVGADSFSESIRMCSEVYSALKKILIQKGYSVNVGDEGGFAPAVVSNSGPFDLLTEAVEASGYKLKKDIVFGIDGAASEFFKNGKYILSKEKKALSSLELSDFYKNLLGKYPIASMEDIFAEDDWEGFAELTRSVGSGIQVVGDDLYTTSSSRLQKGIDMKATNAILIKLNQIGTLTETIETILLAQENGISTIVSHRSGETEDTFIADFAVAFACGQIKTGAPARGERISKYNRLMEIEEELGERSKLAKFPYFI